MHVIAWREAKFQTANDGSIFHSRLLLILVRPCHAEEIKSEDASASARTVDVDGIPSIPFIFDICYGSVRRTCRARSSRDDDKHESEAFTGGIPASRDESGTDDAEVVASSSAICSFSHMCCRCLRDAEVEVQLAVKSGFTSQPI